MPAFVKQTLRYLSVILLLIIFYYLVLVIINCFDEELTPQAELWLEENRSLPAAENAYFFLVGFQAPLGKEPHDFGFYANQEYTALFLQGEYSSQPVIEEQISRLDCPVDVPGFSMRGNGYDLSSEHVPYDTFASLTGSNRELLERYKKLLTYDSMYEDTVVMGGFARPRFSCLLHMQQLYLGNLLLSAETGNFERVQEGLHQDVAFWRMVLGDSTRTVTKNSALRALFADYAFLSGLIAEYGISSFPPAEEQTIYRVLSERERDFSPAIIDDFRLTAWVNSHMGQGPFQIRYLIDIPAFFEYGLRALHRENATLNTLFAIYNPQTGMAKAPASRFHTKRLVVRDAFRKNIRWETKHYWVNPYGQLLVITNALDFSYYVAMAHDLDRFIRMVTLQAKIAERDLPKGVEDVLLEETALYDPVIGRPVNYDPRRGSLRCKRLVDLPRGKDRFLEIFVE